MTLPISRRKLMGTAALTAGAAVMAPAVLRPTAARAATPTLGAIHSFTKAGVTFNSYVSPPSAFSVCSHILEMGDQLLVADASMTPDTAAEVQAFIDSTGKPIHTAYISHEHPDHWGGVAHLNGISFSALPEIRENVREEFAGGGPWTEPTALWDGGDLAVGMTEIGGVPIEYRAYDDNDALKMMVAVLPEQKVAIVSDLVTNGVFYAPGLNRKNWISQLQSMLEDESFDTLLVGHGMPMPRTGLVTAIETLEMMDAAWDAAGTPQEYSDALKAALPYHSVDFFLGLTEAYWDK